MPCPSARRRTGSSSATVAPRVPRPASGSSPRRCPWPPTSSPSARARGSRSTTSTTATFAFATNEPGTFECSVDAAAYAACTSPLTLTGLAAGDHTFAVRAVDLAGRQHLVFVCARYEGVDERIRTFVDLELSIGDYVVTGGELPALVVIDAVMRLLPGAIDELSTAEESFSAGLLEYPQYTRPPSFRGLDVPVILTSGDHGAVSAWRRARAIERTRARRPDLLPED